MPNSTMTNAAVAQQVKKQDANTLMLKYKDPAPSTSPRDHLQSANGRHFRLKLMVKRRHKPISDLEISTIDHHPAS